VPLAERLRKLGMNFRPVLRLGGPATKNTTNHRAADDYFFKRREVEWLSMKPSQSESQDEVIGPALVTSEHVQDRILHTRAGSKVGWSRLTIFEQAHRAGKLIDKERCKSDHATQIEVGVALDRFLAGKRFMELWLIGQASIGGSMDFSRVRCAGSGVPFSDTQFDAKTLLRAIEGQLGTNDWMICRRVIGENYAIAQTVNEISPSYKDSTLARFREALDSLCEAFNRVRVK
jgi:hypothetical protein